MRLHRFYITENIVGKGDISLTDFELIHQMVNVFRFSVGDKVILFDGSGFEYETEIISISKKLVVVKILNQANKSTSDSNISLYLSLIKKSNFELAAEKCTEIGVSEIQPIVSERSEKKDLNLERLNKIVKEASEQSGRVTLPKVSAILALDKAVSQAVSEGKFCVTFHTSKSDCHPLESRTYNEKGGKIINKIALFIGPEGGWTEKEMALFKKNNFQICSLGQNILRAETAAMVAVWEAFHRE
jgi:16S rRNA (uracil1498-N3)-methyltransferase